jgi:mono/diheme cytochrome c family protein
MKRFTQRSALLIVALLCFIWAAHQSQKASSAVGRASQGARDASALYAKYCASCHGKDGRSKTFKAKFNKARNLADPEWQAATSDERIFNSITNGRGKMPAFGKKFSDDEISALANYVRGLLRSPGK